MMITLHELKHGVIIPSELKAIREEGGLGLVVTLTTDAESVYKSLTSRDLKVPTEKTLLGHVSWLREMLALGILESVQWCDTRDMTSDGHTKGSIDRHLLLEVMSGRQSFKHEVKIHQPYRADRKEQHNEEAQAGRRRTTETTDFEAKTPVHGSVHVVKTSVHGSVHVVRM